MIFTITDKDQEKLSSWLKEQELKAIEKQKEEIDENTPGYDVFVDCWENGYPYTGAIGGDLTYSFTPTSIGLATKVKYTLTGETINLTNYDEW